MFVSVTTELQIQPQAAANAEFESQMIDLVLNGVTSVHSRRSYKTGLTAFFTWIKVSGAEPAFTKALVQQYRSALLVDELSSSTVNLRLSPIRKLAREMADNGMLEPAIAAAIERVILSAKYGFIEPSFELDGPYEVTFKRKATSPISSAALLRQARELDIVHLPHVIGLGGKEYRAKLHEVFPKIEFPFAGLGLYEMVAQTKRCSVEGRLRS